MSDETKNDPPADTPPPPAPSYVTREELAAQSEALLARIQGLVEGLSRGAVPAPSAPPAPTFDFNEINEALSEGRGAAEKIAALVDAKVNAIVDQKVRESVDPIRTYGLPNLAQVAKATALSGKDAEVVKRFGREIDEFMKPMGPEVQGSVEAWSRAYALVRGLHADELEREAVERAVRQAAAQAPSPAPQSSAVSYTDDDGSPLPTLEELAGTDAAKTLRDKGIGDLDALAKRMGYKDAREYAKLARTIDKYDGELI